jgi:hypothetical protein
MAVEDGADSELELFEYRSEAAGVKPACACTATPHE